ncbi:MAG: hypothetical protein H6834_12290 [Planctomycetes bacterium]|nr:hypothetical protein [Planctomycetota bacterium]
MDEALRVRVAEGLQARHASWQAIVRRAIAERLERDPTGWLRGIEGPGAGDVTYAIDALLERSIERDLDQLGRELDSSIELVCEGLGRRSLGTRRGHPLRMIVDPIDGTRNIMFDLRSAWILTGVAPDRGDDTRLRDIEVAVQTEIAPSDRMHFVSLRAQRDQGARATRFTLADARAVHSAPHRTCTAEDLGNAYWVFFKFVARERPALSTIEARFVERLVERFDVDPNTLYDDQYICNAGQLHLLVTGRYRFVADLRAWLGARQGDMPLTSKPYDLSTVLIAEEAGALVTGFKGEPFDAPMDFDTPVGFIAYANESLRRRVEPLLLELLSQGVDSQ